MGIAKEGSAYIFFTANSSSIARTTGTPDNPTAAVTNSGMQIGAMKHSYNYTAGGAVYRDPNSGMLLMFYHSELWDGSPVNFWSLIGMAKSTDDGKSWTDLGEIIKPNSPFGSGNHEITGGTYVIVGEYFYIYFRDRLQNGAQINLAVARARVADVVAAANSNSVATWTKYLNGAWSQPGLGGTSSALESANPATNFMSASYNEYSGKYLLVAVSFGASWDLSIIESADGIHWSNRVRIDADPFESYAPSIVGMASTPGNSGQSFYVYYSYSQAGGFDRWSDSEFSRRLITLQGASGGPIVSLSASPMSVPVGTASTLTWSSANATSCNASGAWTGVKSTAGSQSTGSLSANSTFTLTCSGTAGSASQSASVSVVSSTAPPPPTGDQFQASADFASVQGTAGWYYLSSTGAQLTYNAANNLWQGNETYLGLWNDGGHPGNIADAVRRWVSYKAGNIRITGNAHDNNITCGLGAAVAIKKATAILWQSDIANGNTVGVNFDVSVSVVQNDAIDFVINRGADGMWDCDATYFNPTITFTSSTFPAAPSNLVVQ